MPHLGEIPDNGRLSLDVVTRRNRDTEGRRSAGLDHSKRQAIFVLGMHRAGTSAVTRMANLLGAHLPSKLLGTNESNPQGHWEPEDIIALHDDILNSARSSWADIFDIDDRWFASITAANMVHKIRSYITDELAEFPIFVVKDPRTCLIFPLWIDALKQVGIEPHCILPFRSPVEVAESLTKRNAHAMPGGFLPPEHGYLLWLRYVLAAERQTRGLRRSFVAFDALLSDWESEANRIADQLGIVWPLQDRGTKRDISAFLSREHKHHNQGPDAALSRLGSVYERVYGQLQTCVQHPEGGETTFDEAHREFVDSTQLVGDYLRSYSRAVKTLDDGLSANKVMLNSERLARAELQQLVAELKTAAERAKTEHKSEIQHFRGRLGEAEAAAIRDANEAQSKVASFENSLQYALKIVSNYAQDLGEQAQDADTAATAERDKVERLASEAEALLEREYASEVAWSETQHQCDQLVIQRQAILQTRTGRLKSAARAMIRLENDTSGSQLGFMAKLTLAIMGARLLHSEFRATRLARQRAEELAHAAEPKASEMESAAAVLRDNAARLSELHHELVQFAQAAKPKTSEVDTAAALLQDEKDHVSEPPQKVDTSEDQVIKHDYALWVDRYDTIRDADRRAIRARLSRLPYHPLISIVMPVFNTSAQLLRDAVKSVQSQLYPNWQLCIADDASTKLETLDTLTHLLDEDDRIQVVTRQTNGHICAATNTALTLAKGEFVALMDHDDLLPEHALFEVVSELNRDRKLDIIYSDEDHIDDCGCRRDPHFKTDYNPELLLAHNVIGRLGVYRRALIEEIGGFRIGYEGSQDYDLALRAIDATSPDRVGHIPAVLYHWRQEAGKETFSEAFMEKCITSARQALSDHLHRKGELGRVIKHPQSSLWQRVVRPLPDPAPLVSVIIPTRDRPDLLEPCVDGVMNRTDYPNLEIIIVDHQSVAPDTLEFFEEIAQDPRVRILPYEGAFNYSAINNFAALQARGDVFAFLNNDVDVISQEWLREMAALAVLPEVGAVGAKLLYPDGRVQHAGIVLGVGGVANHFFPLFDGSDTGYLGRAVLTSTVSAVTAACLVIQRDIFKGVGGFDAENLPVAFNDVDLCLKLCEQGYRNVWTPHALLYHHESASRGSDQVAEQIVRFGREVEFMQQKWIGVLEEDPFYSPNLDMNVADFSMAFPPRRRKPWRAGGENG